METELFFTIYSNSKIYGHDQIECNFRCLEDFAEKKIECELSKIFERNKLILDIKYKIVAKTKIYIRRNKPFTFILKPKMVVFNCPKKWSKYNNVAF
jgi:hypothetical protein